MPVTQPCPKLLVLRAHLSDVKKALAEYKAAPEFRGGPILPVLLSNLEDATETVLDYTEPLAKPQITCDGPDVTIFLSQPDDTIDVPVGQQRTTACETCAPQAAGFAPGQVRFLQVRNHCGFVSAAGFVRIDSTRKSKVCELYADDVARDACLQARTPKPLPPEARDRDVLVVRFTRLK